MTLVVAPACDLLAWPDLRDAETRARAAEAAWREAQRRAHAPPHGKLQQRRAELAEATRAALQAERELARLRARLDDRTTPR